MGIVYALPNEVMPGLVKASPMTPIPVPRPCTVLPIHPRQPQLRMRGRQTRIEPLQPPRCYLHIQHPPIRLQHHATRPLIARAPHGAAVILPTLVGLSDRGAPPSSFQWTCFENTIVVTRLLAVLRAVTRPTLPAYATVRSASPLNAIVTRSPTAAAIRASMRREWPS